MSDWKMVIYKAVKMIVRFRQKFAATDSPPTFASWTKLLKDLLEALTFQILAAFHLTIQICRALKQWLSGGH